MNVDNFVVLDSIYGKFIVARTCLFQAEALVKTGRTHIESELANIFAIIDTLPPGSVIVDGGANIGFFTVPVAQRVRDRNIKVVAFEPQRQLFNALSGSLALNNLGHVYLHNCGLSDAVGQAQLPEIDYGKINDFGTVSITDDATVQEHAWMATRLVNTVSIDSMNLPRLDFLKLDIEGHEISALAGGINTIQQHRPWIWIEYFITGADVIKSSLSSLTDYEFYIVDYQNMICVPVEKFGAISTQNLVAV
jgi:FkbM family methyltransferase